MSKETHSGLGAQGVKGVLARWGSDFVHGVCNVLACGVGCILHGWGFDLVELQLLHYRSEKLYTRTSVDHLITTRL